MRQEIRYLLVLSLIAVGSYLGSPSLDGVCGQEERSSEAEQIVATVNGQPILAERLKPMTAQGLQRFRRFSRRKETPELVKSVRDRALGELIDTELIHQESQKLTIEEVAGKVEEKLEAMKAKHGGDERFQKYLEMRRLTEEDFRASLETRLYVDEYLTQQGVLDPEIPEERIREMYEGDPKSYSRDESIEVSHILIAVHDAEEKELAKKEAERIHQEILDGKDFAEMAKEHSDCNSASGGGDLGHVKRKFMPKEFDSVAFALEVDSVSEVVESKFGYHIIKLFGKQDAGLLPYEQVREFIKKFLQEKESQVKLAAHVAELRRKAKIEIVLDEPL